MQNNINHINHNSNQLQVNRRTENLLPHQHLQINLQVSNEDVKIRKHFQHITEANNQMNSRSLQHLGTDHLLQSHQVNKFKHFKNELNEGTLSPIGSSIGR